ncbi:hypothetical protein FEE96_13740 [Parasedimentitalea maritima]|uniref:Uncharacterized protein n=1 Tax=Parasedimentitalea maritima TaxID=2578117 RepID=A0ABY2UY60_9RHOB|nr:hypothetical protein [Zongyanglinia marina]TLP62791.1 hypothetical protein FEE96_13740 [Zongyanglinia marina]
MGLRKSLGIIAVCTQVVVVVDYNMQSQQAGLGPGELSMKAYSAIVQARYNTPAATASGLSAVQQGGLGSDAPPTPVCIRRGTSSNCQ